MVRKEKINNVNLEKKKGFIICTGVVVIFLIVIMIPMDLKAFGLMKRKILMDKKNGRIVYWGCLLEK